MTRFVLTVAQCVLGGERSGKSTFCQRWKTGTFLEDYKPAGQGTVSGCSCRLIFCKDITLKKEKVHIKSTKEVVDMEVLDTGSILTDDFETRLVQWNEWASGYMLMYNINSKASFENIPKLFNALIKSRQFRMTPILVVATKSDLEEDRKVSKDDGNALAARYRCKFIGKFIISFRF
jgi:GTPase SAR1 family protein